MVCKCSPYKIGSAHGCVMWVSPCLLSEAIYLDRQGIAVLDADGETNRIAVRSDFIEDMLSLGYEPVHSNIFKAKSNFAEVCGYGKKEA